MRDYAIIEEYRRARKITWKELFLEMGLRDVDVSTIRKIAIMTSRKPRPAIARKLNGWLDRNADKIRAIVRGGPTRQF